MKSKKILAFLLCLTMIFSLCGNGLVAFAEEGKLAAPQISEEPAENTGAEDPAEDELAGAPDEGKEEIELADGSVLEGEAVDPADVQSAVVDGKLNTVTVDNPYKPMLTELERDEDERVRVLVVLDEPSALDQGTTVVSATLVTYQGTVIDSIQNQVQDIEITRQYGLLFNGFAATVRYGDIAKIRAVDGVKGVLEQRRYYPAVDSLEKVDFDDPSKQISPMSNSDGPMIGREDAWKDGFLGAGMKIAIVDTGIDEDHPSFRALTEDELGTDALTQEDVAALIPSLPHAKNITAEQVYHSTKIPFGFNYLRETPKIDHSDGAGDHGTHVAGIAAADVIDTTDVVGVAPYAQLLVMKVFDGNDGAYDEDIMAAVEDALVLGADVINMSLGSPAGFTGGDVLPDGSSIDDIYSKVTKAGVVLSFSAGNEGAMGEGNFWGSGTNLSSNPDNGTAGSPGSYGEALAVASVNNIGQTGYYVELNGEKYIYIDTSAGTKVKAMTTLADGGPYEIAVATGYGEDASQFGDATGKIALVQRGNGVNFTTKAQSAATAGAIACLVYNNDSGTISMALDDSTTDIPCVSITQAAGEAIKAALVENPELKMTVSSTVGTAATEDGYTMSDFSSWGVAPDLSLKPDIAAPGGNIYSSLDGGEYGTMSGTSMAAPNVSGISALVAQHAKALGVESEKLNDFVSSLLMSTAVPLPAGEDLYYSPRQQGAGLANAGKAIATNVTLTVPGVDRPKAELRDDPNKSGSYSFLFNAENFSKHNAYYDPKVAVTTEQVFESEDGNKYMGLSPRTLESTVDVKSDGVTLTYDYDENSKTNSHDAYLLWTAGTVDEPDFFRYDLNADKELTDADTQAYLDQLVGKSASVDLTDKVILVKAGTLATVQVAIQVAEAGKTYMDDNFPNGIFVDGFAFLNARTGTAADLSLPFLAFYGDWTKAPTIDTAYWWDNYGQAPVDSDVPPTGSQYFNILWSSYDPYFDFLPGVLAQEWLPGTNGYYSDEEGIDPAHISVSPNKDGYVEGIDDIYVSLLRNAKRLTISYTDKATGEVLYEQSVDNVKKSYYSSSYGQVVPYVASWDIGKGNFYDFMKDGASLPDGTKVDLTVKAELDYDLGEDRESANEHSEWTTTITVDNDSPDMDTENMEIVSVIGKDGQELYLKTQVSDVCSAAAMMFIDATGSSVTTRYPMIDNGTDTLKDENGKLLYEITGKPGDNGVVYDVLVNITDKVYLDAATNRHTVFIYFGDYAFNEGGWKITLPENLFEGEGGDQGGGEEDQVTVYLFRDSAYSAAAYDPTKGLVYAIGKDDGALYAVLFDQNHSASKLTADALLASDPEAEGYQITGMACDNGKLTVIVGNDGSTSYVYDVDMDSYSLNANTRSTINTGNVAAPSYVDGKLVYWYSDGGKGHIATVGAGGSVTNMADVTPTDKATASAYYAGGKTLYVVYESGDAYGFAVTMGASPKAEDEFPAASNFTDVLAMYVGEVYLGELPEGIGDEEEPEPSAKFFTFYDSTYSAATYDASAGLVYAIGATDGALYAVQPGTKESVKLTDGALAESGYTTTGLTMNNGDLYAMFIKPYNEAKVCKIDKTTGATLETWTTFNGVGSAASIGPMAFVNGKVAFWTDQEWFNVIASVGSGNSELDIPSSLVDAEGTPTAAFYDGSRYLYLAYSDGSLYKYDVTADFAETLVAESGYAGVLVLSLVAFTDGELPTVASAEGSDTGAVESDVAETTPPEGLMDPSEGTEPPVETVDPVDPEPVPETDPKPEAPVDGT